MGPHIGFAGRRPRFLRRTLARGARAALALSLLLSSALPTFAAGDVDATFDPAPGVAAPGIVWAVARQPDGKVVVGGVFTGVGGAPRSGVIRIGRDGLLDDSFFHSGPGANGGVFALALQPDGKILAGGNFVAYDGVPRGNVARLNADGTLDTSFLSSGRGANGGVFCFALQPDGKVLIGGFFSTVHGAPRSNLARLNADGTLDTSFRNVSFSPGSSVEEMALQPDGKVLLGGFFTSVDGSLRGRVARLNPDGSLDASFGGSGPGADGAVLALALQPDGKVLVGGDFTSFDGATRGDVARLNPDGSLDSSFLNSRVGDGFVEALGLQPDGKVIAAGFFTSVNSVARLNADGTTDGSFLGPDTGTIFVVNAVALQPDGKILIGGVFSFFVGSPPQATLARLDASGRQDGAFPEPLTNSGVRAMALQPGGGLVVVGSFFTTTEGELIGRVARHHPDGRRDTSFPNSGERPSTNVHAVALQPDGKILVGGRFTTFGSATRRRIARLNPDGSLDATFAGSGTTGLNSDVNAIALQPDGRVLIGGAFSFTSAGVADRFKVARLLASGELDQSFNGPAALAGPETVFAVGLQPDGKVVVGGTFGALSVPQRGGVARLNADGTLDTSFVGGVSGEDEFTDDVLAVALQPDGKVIVGGDFTRVNGAPRNRLARLNPDGTLDESFLSIGAGVNGTVSTIVVQPDGKVLIGGLFSSVHGIARWNFARLKADGSLDETFSNFAPGANGRVTSLAVQPDGKVIAGGDFSSVNGATRFGLARLTADTSGPNPIDTPANFVRQHYRDFLNREPDQAGLAFWTNEIEKCGADRQCREVKRVNVSAAFFLSIEFQETGYLAYRARKVAFGNLPGKPVPITRAAMLQDVELIGSGVIVGVDGWQRKLEQNKQAYFEQVAASRPFTDLYPQSSTPEQFVDALNANAGGALSQAERDALANDLEAGATSRAGVLRAVAEDPDLVRDEFRPAFVLMQYFGYLRRDPDAVGFDGRPDPEFKGFNFWLSKLNQFNGDFARAEMVKAFITSIEYRQRFGQ